MSDEVVIAIAAVAVPQTILATATLVQAIMNYRLTKVQTAHLDEKLDAVAVDTKHSVRTAAMKIEDKLESITNGNHK